MKQQIDVCQPKVSTFGSTWILTAIFIVLKLTKIVSWSWWLVFLPVLVTATIWIGTIVLVLIIGNSVKFIKKAKTKVIH